MQYFVNLKNKIKASNKRANQIKIQTTDTQSLKNKNQVLCLPRSKIIVVLLQNWNLNQMEEEKKIPHWKMFPLHFSRKAWIPFMSFFLRVPCGYLRVSLLLGTDISPSWLLIHFAISLTISRKSSLLCQLEREREKKVDVQGELFPIDKKKSHSLPCRAFPYSRERQKSQTTSQSSK